MKRFLGALSALFICASAFAQGGAVSGQVVKSVSGQAATVRVCTSNATGTPCAPTATIYSDEALSIAKDNPAATDIQGRYKYFAQPGSYKEQVTVNGITSERTVTVFATRTYVDSSVATAVAPLATRTYVDDAVADIDTSMEVWATSDVQTAIGLLPPTGGTVRLLPNHTYAITCGGNQINTGSKVVRIAGSGETSVITGSGCALVTLAMDGSTVESLKITQSAAHDDTVGVLVSSGSSREVIRWAIRDVFFDSEGKKKGSALKTVFGLEGLMNGGEIRGWNCGVELTSYDTAHRSNANHFSGTRVRWGNTGFCIGSDDIDNVFIDGSVIEGNTKGIDASSGLLSVSKTHFENMSGTDPQVRLAGDARIVSVGNFYGRYPSPSPNLDILTTADNAYNQLSVGDTLNDGVTHNGTTSPFLIDSPTITPSMTGPGMIVWRDHTHNVASNENFSYAFYGYAWFDLRMPLLSTTGDTKIFASDGHKVAISNYTGATKIAEFDPATQKTAFFGPLVLSPMTAGGKGLCQKTDKSIGYCSTALDASGNCTCN